eukprot:4673431-Pyramimonas_sp.AAC.1
MSQSRQSVDRSADQSPDRGNRSRRTRLSQSGEPSHKDGDRSVGGNLNRTFTPASQSRRYRRGYRTILDRRRVNGQRSTGDGRRPTCRRGPPGWPPAGPLAARRWR